MAFNRNYLSWQAIKACVLADVITLRLFGDAHAWQTYCEFTAPHPNLPLIPRKALGAALLKLDGTFEEYFQHKLGRLAKKNLRRAINNKYTYETVEPSRYFDDVMKANRSLAVRGGREMEHYYFDSEEFAAVIKDYGVMHAVKCPQGKVVAYAFVASIGEAWRIGHILGHGDHQKYGIMYLLMTKIIEQKFSIAKEPGAPSWIVYDAWLGAPDGMRQFKALLGLSPYWVRWRWAGKVPLARESDADCR